MRREPSMKKAIIGVAAVGVVVGLGVVGGRLGHKMRAHFGQMAAHCKQMMAGQFEEQGEAPGTREPGEQMAAQFRGHGEAAETREQSQHEAPQFVGQGEAVGAA
jgi:hypothetical protein